MPAVAFPEILFENEHFLAADKPAGWLSVPSRMGAEDARPCLGRVLERGAPESGGSAFGRLWPVHRLDIEVTGLVLFARNADAHRAASGWFESRQVAKLYRALSEGTPDPAWREGAEMVWESLLVRGKKRTFEAPHGKPSRTRAVWKGRTGEFMTWELEPLTGRSHQLRVELAKRKCPIVGDMLYGAAPRSEGEGIALRSVLLDFTKCPGAERLGLGRIAAGSS